MNVARPSGAQDISNKPGIPRTLFTRRPGRNLFISPASIARIVVNKGVERRPKPLALFSRESTEVAMERPGHYVGWHPPPPESYSSSSNEAR